MWYPNFRELSLGFRDVIFIWLLSPRHVCYMAFVMPPLLRMQLLFTSVLTQKLILWHRRQRVSPLTQQAISRLELLSCLLLARLTSHVLEALQSVIDVKMGSCFTDLRVALYWIQGEDKQWKQFVHNRAVEIRKLVPVKHWRHCAGKDNPADMPSLGITPEDLDASLTWRRGPDWLPKFSVTELIDASGLY